MSAPSLARLSEVQSRLHGGAVLSRLLCFRTRAARGVLAMRLRDEVANHHSPAMPVVRTRTRLLKLSGEMLGEDERIFSPAALARIGREIASAPADLRLGIVVGGGNILRGRDVKDALVVATRADDMGMLATLMNAIALRDALERAGLDAQIVAPHAVPGIAACYDRDDVAAALDAGIVVIFGGGTGHPFFTTDTAAALRAGQIGADELLKASTVDGVYSADPRKDQGARRFATLTFDQAIAGRYGVMDTAAFALCQEQRIKIRIFDARPAGAIAAALGADPPGTLVG